MSAIGHAAGWFLLALLSILYTYCFARAFSAGWHKSKHDFNGGDQDSGIRNVSTMKGRP